jgi:hypothetical protein
MPGARRTAGPILAVTVGALLRELPACGCGRADLVAAPNRAGSRLSRFGMAARAPESARCLPSRPALAMLPRQLTPPIGGLAFARLNSVRGRTARDELNLGSKRAAGQASGKRSGTQRARNRRRAS